MRMRQLGIWVCCALAMAVVALPASAKVLDIPNFATDPSGPGFTISAIGPMDGRSSNISAPPELTYGATSLPDGTLNCLQMRWDPTINTESSSDATAGWRLTFGTDPSLINHVLTLSINPPGGIVANNFVGIKSLTIDFLDNAKNSCGAWDFNTDQMGQIVAVSDPGAIGLASVYNNVQNTVTINIGNGPVAGSATVSGNDRNNVPFNFTAPNGVILGNGNFGNVGFIDFYEDGRLRGQALILGQNQLGNVNFWDHVTLTPEPATLSLLAVGGLLALRRRRSK